jgi:hypothetical protein
MRGLRPRSRPGPCSPAPSSGPPAASKRLPCANASIGCGKPAPGRPRPAASHGRPATCRAGRTGSPTAETACPGARKRISACPGRLAAAGPMAGSGANAPIPATIGIFVDLVSLTACPRPTRIKSLRAALAALVLSDSPPRFEAAGLHHPKGVRTPPCRSLPLEVVMPERA